MTKKSWELQGEANITWNMAIPIMEAWRGFLVILGEYRIEELEHFKCSDKVVQNCSNLEIFFSF